MRNNGKMNSFKSTWMFHELRLGFLFFFNMFGVTGCDDITVRDFELDVIS